ncbi:MAG: discoidin domain-containing protein, partial [Spirochaetales bacterium]|nr:discoidin domain-containing protein [Spirochaetales bacterium]
MNTKRINRINRKLNLENGRNILMNTTDTSGSYTDDNNCQMSIPPMPQEAARMAFGRLDVPGNFADTKIPSDKLDKLIESTSTHPRNKAGEAERNHRRNPRTLGRGIGSIKQFMGGLCFLILAFFNIPLFAGVDSISASSSLDSTHQASNMMDGNMNTGWKASAVSGDAWIELEFDNPSRVYQIELQGQIITDFIDVLFFQNNQYKGYTAGTISNVSDNAVSILTNSDELLTEKIRLNIKDAASSFEIKEIYIISEAQHSYYRKLKPLSITGTGSAPLISQAINAADGDLSTYWQANSYYLSSLHPENLDDIIGSLPGNYNHSADFNLAGPSSISLIKLYFRENARGLFKVYLCQGSSESLIFQTTNPTSGWMRIQPSANQNTTKIKITVEGTDIRTGGIAEAEFWGYGKYPDLNNIRFDEPQNLANPFVMNFEAPGKKPFELQIATQGTHYANLQVKINQEEFSAYPSTVLNGNEIYSIPVPASAVWNGSNYLEIEGNAYLNLLNVNFLWEKFYEPFVQWNNTMASEIIVLPLSMQLETTRVVQAGNADVNSLEYGFWNDLIIGNNQKLLAFNSSGNNIDRINIITPPQGALELYGSPSKEQLPEVRIIWPPVKALSTNFPLETTELILYTPDASTSVTVNGVAATNYSINPRFKTLSFESINLVPRNYTSLEFYAIDSQARVNKFEISISPFAGSILNLDQTDETITKDSIFLVSGTIQSGYTLKIQGHSVTVYGGIFYDFISLSSGMNLIDVSAYSNGSLAETRNLRVIKTAELFFEITSPENYSCQSDDSVTIEGTINGYGPFEVEIMGQTTTVTGSSFTSQPLALAPGENIIEVKITDQAGTSKTKYLTVNVDSQAPVINLLTPVNGALLNSSTLEISGNISDSNLSTVSLKINGVLINNFSLIAASFNYIHDLSMLMDGPIMIEIEAHDMAGNITLKTASITLDTTPPDDFEVMVTPAGWTSDNQPVIEFASSDNGSGIDHYAVNVNRIVSTGEVTDENGNIFVNYDSYPVSSDNYDPSTHSIRLAPLDVDGEYSIMIVAVDKAGNKTPAAGTLRLDRENPLSPSGFKAISGINRAFLNWDDDTNEVSKYRIYRNGSLYLELQRDESDLILGNFIDGGLTAGTEYDYAIAAIDQAGNVSPLSNTATIVVGKEEKTIEVEGGEAAFENMEVTIPDGQFESGNKVVLTAVEELPDNRFAEKVGNAFSIKRLDSTDSIIDEAFTKYIDLTFKVDPLAIPEGFNVWNLGIYYWNETGKNWEHLQDSYYDAENNTLHATVHHFSEYQVMAAPYRDPGMNSYNDAGMSPAGTTFNNHHESVSPQSGSLRIDVNDFTLPGPDNFDLVISRSYSTSEAELFAKEGNLAPIKHFAFGWTINLPWLENHDDKKYLRLESGAKIKIEEWKDGSFVYNQNGTYFKLTHDEANKDYTLQLKSGEQYIFNENGQVTSKTNRSGKFQITYNYDSTNPEELSYIEDAVQRKVNFQYETKGEHRQITAINYTIDNTPETIVFTYDVDDNEQAIGKLTSFTDFMGRTTKYEYTNVMNLEYGYDITDSVESHKYLWYQYSERVKPDALGVTLYEGSYYPQHWPKGTDPSDVDYNEISSSSQKISLQLLNTITYPTGAVQSYGYNENRVGISKRPYQFKHTTTKRTFSNGYYNRYDYIYTLSYNVAYQGYKLTVKSSTINGATTNYEYELNSAIGQAGGSDYLPRNRYINSCKIKKDQFITSYNFDYTYKTLDNEETRQELEKKEGNPERTGYGHEVTVYNRTAWLKYIAPANATDTPVNNRILEMTGTILNNKTTGGLNQGDFDTITYSYHPATELIKQVHHSRGNYNIDYTYDSYGNRIKTIDGRTGKISETFYLDPASNNPNIMNLIDYTIETDTVDNNSIIKTDFVYEESSYTEIGKPSKIIISSNNADTEPNEVKMTYTDNGLLETKKSHDITTTYVYDEKSYLKEVQLSGFNVNDNEDHIIYDGDTISTYYHFYPDTGLLNYVKNNHNIITEYKYDKINRLTDIYLKEGEDVDTATKIWHKQNSINDNDNIITATDERDHKKVYSFDSLNRPDLISEKIPVGGLTVPNTIDNVYDEWGRLTDIIKIDYDYEVKTNGEVDIVGNAKQLQTSFKYDDLNRIQYIIYPDENGITNTDGDPDNWTPHVKLVYTDEDNRIEIYNENNELISNQKSDWAGRLTEAIQKVSTENDDSYTWNYQYNSKGNVLNSNVVINTQEGDTQTYQLGTNIYNGFGQLKESHLPSVDIWDAENETLKTVQTPIQSYNYDEWGNLIHALSPKMNEMDNANEAKPEIKYNKLNMPIQGIQKYKDGETWKEIITETFYNDRGQIVKTQNINENGEAVNIWKY